MERTELIKNILHESLVNVVKKPRTREQLLNFFVNDLEKEFKTLVGLDAWVYNNKSFFDTRLSFYDISGSGMLFICNLRFNAISNPDSIKVRLTYDKPSYFNISELEGLKLQENEFLGKIKVLANYVAENFDRYKERYKEIKGGRRE